MAALKASVAAAKKGDAGEKKPARREKAKPRSRAKASLAS